MAASPSASCTSTTCCAPGSRSGDQPSAAPSSQRSPPGGRLLYPALELPQRHLPDHQHAGRAVVETGYRNEILTAVLLEDTRALDRDLLERFEPICPQ